LSRELGYASDKLLLIINRENSHGAISRADIEENLKFKVVLGLRSDGRAMVNAINAGEPALLLDRRGRLSRGIRQLVQIISTGQLPTPPGAVTPTRQTRGPLAWLVRR
jgi:Flp pilus assembly CpaE family ATPase